MKKLPKLISKEEFEKMILKAHDPNFNCAQCFSRGARCNRMALEINSAYNAMNIVPDE